MSDRSCTCLRWLPSAGSRALSPKAKKPFPFYLRKGEHTLRLVNVQQSLNLDFIAIHSPDEKVE